MWNRWESVATSWDYDEKLKDKGARIDGAKTKRGSYFPRIQIYRPYGRLVAGEHRG